MNEASSQFLCQRFLAFLWCFLFLARTLNQFCCLFVLYRFGCYLANYWACLTHILFFGVCLGCGSFTSGVTNVWTCTEESHLANWTIVRLFVEWWLHAPKQLCCNHERLKCLDNVASKISSALVIVSVVLLKSSEQVSVMPTPSFCQNCFPVARLNCPFLTLTGVHERPEN